MKLTGYNLSLESLEAIVSGQEKISLASKARQRMQESRAIVLDILDSEHQTVPILPPFKPQNNGGEHKPTQG